MKFLRWIFDFIKVLLALIVLIFDELGGFVRWLRQYVKPLEWYFVLIQRLANFLMTCLKSPNLFVRTIAPYLALPFLILPMSVIIPAKILLLRMIAVQPLAAIPAFLVVKLFGAIFIKETWNILRPVGRHSRVIAVVDNQWLRLESWTRRTLQDFTRKIKATKVFREVRETLKAFKLLVVRFFRK